MKKSIVLLFILLIVMLFTGCTNDSLSSASKIVSPENNDVSIEGKWKVDNVSGLAENINNNWLGVTAEFTSKEASFGDEYCKKPSYKIKLVDSTSFLLYGYKIKPEQLNIKQKQLQVITITSENNFFHEFIKVDDSTLITNINGLFIYLKKISPNTDYSMKSVSDNDKVETQTSGSANKKLKSGILLGLRSYSKDTASGSDIFNKSYSYRTLWISYTDNTLNPILQTSDLFVPRMNGFWNLKVTRLQSGSHSEDILSGTPFTKPLSNTSTTSSENNSRKIINFIGNDYISIEKNTELKRESSIKVSYQSQLNLLPIDNLSSEIGIKLSEFSGSDGRTAMKNGAMAYLNSLTDQAQLSKNYSEDDWGIFRRNGNWILKGRLNSLTDNTPSISQDYYIPLPTPKTLVGFDELYPSWSSIKERVPDAVDAFSSPNKDIVIILTNTTLSIYEIKNNNIEPRPLAQVKLKENESAIMDQWALGEYTDMWSKNFSKNIVTAPTMIKVPN